MADIPRAIDASLSKLQTDYVDLYLIHTPYYTKEDAELQRAWKAIEGVKESGKARSVGIANFQRPHVEAILEVASVVPAVNQIEFHPYLQRDHDYIPWMREQGIEVSAFKALAPLTVGKGGPLDKPLVRIARKYGVSVDAVLLKWQMNQNVIPITTTGTKERISEYLEAVSLLLTPEEQEEITRVGLKHHLRWWGNQFFEHEDHS